MFLKEQTGFFSLLLWFGAFLCFFAYIISKDKNDKSNLYLGIVLAVVVFLTGVFSYMQSSKAASLMDDFKNMIPKKSDVKRDGTFDKIDANTLVSGDIVQVEGGQQIPADLILFDCTEMKVNNASLTGEAEELLRQATEKNENVFESPNVAFFGTECKTGKGTGVVFRTGDDTAIGRIANLTQSAETKQTPLAHEIERFIILISAVAVILGLTFFLYGLIVVEYDVVDMLVFAIGIIVANVPEGLLATVTVSLALTAKRMATKMVLVKNLESVETLGSTSCICSDKTGTLTQNRMTVSQLFLNRKVVNAEVNLEIFKKEFEAETAKGTNGRPEQVKAPEYDSTDKLLLNMMYCLALATTTTFNFEPEDDVVVDYHRRMAKKNGTAVTFYPTKVVINEFNEQQKGSFQEAKRGMEIEEKQRNFMKRLTKGDASETGIVRFLTPILMDKYGGPIVVEKNNAEIDNALDQIRKNYPVHKD
jgi:magnesium-transporting ATPase (P-type)